MKLARGRLLLGILLAGGIALGVWMLCFRATEAIPGWRRVRGKESAVDANLSGCPREITRSGIKARIGDARTVPGQPVPSRSALSNLASESHYYSNSPETAIVGSRSTAGPTVATNELSDEKPEEGVIGPPETAAQIHNFVRERLIISNDKENETLARQMLVSEDPVLRYAGGALLSGIGRLDDQALDRIGRDENLAVPFMMQGWLCDNGIYETAQRLQDALNSRKITLPAIVGLLESRQLDSSGERIAIDAVSAIGASDQKAVAGILTGLVNDESRHYSVRMKSLVQLQNTVPPLRYTEMVGNLEKKAGQDEMWQAGLMRLREKAENNEADGIVVPQFGTDDVHLALADIESEGALEDLALQIEYVLGQTNGVVSSGSAEVLKGYLDDFEKLPWTDEQQVSLSRLHGLCRILSARDSKQSPMR